MTGRVWEDSRKAGFKAELVGQTLHQVQTPAAVLDLALVERNCERMLQTAQKLNIGFRPHIKTHKSVELTEYQVSDDTKSPANIIVSTVVEAEKILPLLKEYRRRGRQVNVLFSFPLYPSCIDRLASISGSLGEGGLSVMIDHPAQIPLLSSLRDKSGGVVPLVFLKVDMGYGRAGVIPGSPECSELVAALVAAEKSGICVLHGLYAHAGHSYAGHKEDDSVGLLAAEFLSLQPVGDNIRALAPERERPIVLSVGATPTTTSLQVPAVSAQEAAAPGSAVTTLSEALSSLRGKGYQLEVHAGVYTVLDLQQLATHARDASLLSARDLAFTVLAEVSSVYPNRTNDGTPQAMINAGCLALGREPCQRAQRPDYAGFGIPMPWGACEGNVLPGPEFPTANGGWQVVKVSQEHGVLGWFGGVDGKAAVPPKVGGRVRVWPNHACIAGAGFDRYLVVDSRNTGKEDEIVDVWPRWNGW